MTLLAFEIPGYGEYFLRELQRSNDIGLDGFILTEAASVDVESTTSGGGGDNDARPLQEAEFDGGVPPSSSSNNQQQQPQQPGMVMIAGHAMNIWAIAAVAALGAMFLVIVLCTSICTVIGVHERHDGRKASVIVYLCNPTQRQRYIVYFMV
jgi:hypothetical protein